MTSMNVPEEVEKLSKPAPVSVWLAWTLATPFAALAAVVLLYVYIFAGKAFIPGFNEDRAAGYGFIPGLAVAMTLAQVWVLSRILKRPWGWLAASILGWGTSLVLLALLPRLGVKEPLLSPENGMPAFSLIIGLVLGSAQGLFLRQYFERAWVWVAASLISWVLTGLVVGASITSIFEVIWIGLAPGALTGAVLAWVLVPRAEK